MATQPNSQQPTKLSYREKLAITIANQKAEGRYCSNEEAEAWLDSQPPLPYGEPSADRMERTLPASYHKVYGPEVTDSETIPDAAS